MITSSCYVGHSRNIYFPFDIMSDTPIDVAHEMVKELEITDWEPSEIAKMIDQEISQLVPDWRPDCNSEPDEYPCGDGEGDGGDGDITHPFYCASPYASSHGSLCGFEHSSSAKGLSCHGWRGKQKNMRSINLLKLSTKSSFSLMSLFGTVKFFTYILQVIVLKL